MKFCTNCGAQIADDAKFCTNCGTPVVEAPVVEAPVVEAPVVEAPVVEAPVVEAPVVVVNDDPAQIVKEKECLDGFFKMFKAERLAWKIYGIVLLVLCCLLITLGGFVFLVGIGMAVEGYYDAEFLSAAGFIYLIYGFLSLPAAIVDLNMVRRAKYYMDTIYSEARPAVTRCSAVGMIVLGAIFNPIAMIFIIINFARNKSNADLLSQIVTRQQNFRG